MHPPPHTHHVSISIYTFVYLSMNQCCIICVLRLPHNRRKLHIGHKPKLASIISTNTKTGPFVLNSSLIFVDAFLGPSFRLAQILITWGRIGGKRVVPARHDEKGSGGEEDGPGPAASAVSYETAEEGRT